MKHKTMIIIAILVAIGFSQTSYKSDGQARLAPRMLNYQGYLTDTQGNPVTNPSASMTFAIFDAASAGNQKWSEIQSSVAIDKGIFNVLLGSVMPIPDSVFTNSTSRYLQLTVGGQVLFPRTQIVSLPYAYTSIYSDTAAYARVSAPDNDWIRSNGKVYPFNVTDTVGIRTTTPRYALDVNGMICGGVGDTINAIYGTVIGGYSNKVGDAATDTGATIGGGYDNTIWYKYSTISGGYNNIANGNYVTIAGGSTNRASTSYSTIGGGYSNVAIGHCSVIAGGDSNCVETDNIGTIGGGFDNIDSASAGTIGGGWFNLIRTSGSGGTISGGYQNIVAGVYSTVGGGNTNTASDNYSTVSGGRQNLASGENSAICGGSSNTCVAINSAVLSGNQNQAGASATDTAAIIAGGFGNRVLAPYAFVGGGRANEVYGYTGAVLSGRSNAAGDGISDSFAVVVGGNDNFTNGLYATIGGGRKNYAYGAKTTIAGGDSNQIVGNYNNGTIAGGRYNRIVDSCGFIGGGYNNQILSAYGTIGGGCNNTVSGYTATIGGGADNTVMAYAGTIPGGYLNVVGRDSSGVKLGNYAFAAGFRAKARAHGAFVWGDSYNADVASDTANMWVARCSGGVKFFSNGTMTTGVRLAPGGGSWSTVSDRDLKENFQPVDGDGILNKIEQMWITTWNYKSQDPSIRHIGPMAQDFATFGVGEDDKHITTIDADGIALAAIPTAWES